MAKEDNKKQNYQGFETFCIHGGQRPNPIHGAVMPGIELSTTYAQKSPGVTLGFEYSRSSNPTRVILENLISSLEKGKYGCAFASGSSTTASICSILPTGSHIVCIDDVYGGTNRYLRHIAEKVNGMEASFLNLQKVQDLDKHIKSLKKKPKMLWIETPTNPTLQVVDISKLSHIAHQHDMIVVVDNTFATPYNQQPLILGADIVVHSITKYLNGHTDVVMGIAVTNCPKLYERIKFVQNSIGAVPSPFDCYMVIRGVKTLHLRMEQHAKNALQVASFLEKHPKVEKVFYPGLRSHPNYEIASKQMKTPGGMVTFLIKGGLSESKQFLENLKIFHLAESLGAVESLAEHPAIMTHASVPSEQRKLLGISDNLIRLSVGVENCQDIINDLSRALDAVKTKSSKL